MKQLHRNYLLFTVFLITSIRAGAQMLPMTTTIKTPYGNIPHTYYVGSPNYFYGQRNISGRYEFKVVLKNDSTFTAKTKINLKEDEDHSLTVKHHGEKEQIFPNDTKSISRITPTGKILKGIPADSCWLFKIIDGEIKGYAFLAEEMDMYVIAIQGGEDGPIVPLTKANLIPLIISDKKSLVAAKKNKLHRALATYNRQARLRETKQTKKVK